jgi:hypothetical protein
MIKRLMASLLALGVLLGLAVGWATPVWGDAVDQALVDESTQLWQESVHALNDVNCSSCHQDEKTQAFVAHPDQESCRSCHEQAVDTFLLGKHGIRLREGQTPLTPAIARLPMKAEAHDMQMTCATCHDVHSVNTVQAAVDSCLTCHNDTHSLNYENSRHAELFAADRTLPRPSGRHQSAVPPATCLAMSYRKGDNSITLVNHNNTYTLLTPRSHGERGVS